MTKFAQNFNLNGKSIDGVLGIHIQIVYLPIQCDQIGRFLNALGDKVSFKSTQNIW